MRLELATTAQVLFSLSDTPDALPTASCYAGAVLLGSATVTALGGTNDYQATYALPGAGIADGTPIAFRVNADVSATALPTLHLIAGVLGEEVVASNTIPSAADNATQVRTELAAELARIDAAISTRSTFAGGAVASVTNPVTTDAVSRTASQATGFAVPGDAMTLTGAYEASLVAAIDARLLDAGDATDLIASIVTRIGNTNVDQAAFVAAVKAALFSAGSASNKLDVDALGRVTTPDSAAITAARDAALANGVAIAALPSAQQVADLVWEEVDPTDLALASQLDALVSAADFDAFQELFDTSTPDAILGGIQVLQGRLTATRADRIDVLATETNATANKAAIIVAVGELDTGTPGTSTSGTINKGWAE